MCRCFRSFPFPDNSLKDCNILIIKIIDIFNIYNRFKISETCYLDELSLMNDSIFF